MNILFREVKITAALMLALCLGSTAALAQTSMPPPSSTGGFSDTVEDFVNSWLAMVSRTQAEQPHWITPLVTVTPRLEQEVRYDQYFQSAKNGLAIDNFGGGKGLELIPEEH